MKHRNKETTVIKWEDLEKFGIKFQDNNVKFAYKQALQQYGKKLQQEIKTIYKFNNRPINQQDLEQAKRAIASRGANCHEA